jgi:hypothetical protein
MEKDEWGNLGLANLDKAGAAAATPPSVGQAPPS